MMSHSFRARPSASLLAGLLIFLPSCNEASATVDPGLTRDEILIGSSSALRGHASFLGTQYTRGSLAWFKEVNAKGGVHGRKLRLLAYDDQYDPPKTVANTQKLINEDGVFMLFDYVGTPTSVKIIGTVHHAQIPALGFFTGAEALRTPFRPYMFHVRASYFAEAEGAINYFVDKLGLTKVAVMYQDDAFGLAVLRGAQLAVHRRNLEIVATDTFERGSMDVERAVETIRASGAQAVVMVGTYSPLARFIKVCHEKDYDPYFHTVSFVGSEAFGQEIRDKQGVDPSRFERIIVTQVVPSPFSEDLAAVQDYRRLAKEHFPNDAPNYVALEGFINAQILTAGLQSAGANLTRTGLIQALEQMKDFDVGIGKTVSYGPVDRKGLEGIYYSRLHRDGTFQIFSPE